MKDYKPLCFMLVFLTAICFQPAVAYSEIVNGNVYDGSPDTPTALTGVTVSVEINSSVVATASTGAGGFFEIDSSNVIAGAADITFSAAGYVTAEGAFTILSGTTTIDQVLLAPDSADLGIIDGTLIDATTTNTPVAGAAVTLYEGINHTEAGFITVYTTTTAVDGSFEITDVPAGSYTLLAERDGYSDAFINVVAVGNATKSYEHSISPAAAEGEIRIVLTWGENPSDLDSHLYTPEIDGTSHHLYYANRGSYSTTSPPYIALDRDDVTSFGPETITISQSYDGEYEYKVYHYAGSGTLATSGATVKVYDSTGLLFTVNVPSSLSEPLWWDVFRYNGTTRSFTSPSGQSLFGGGGSFPIKLLFDEDDNSCFILTAAGSLF